MGLIALAILYGIFFLIFKLAWILSHRKRNFWPLVLAGVATLLVMLLCVWTTYRAYQTYAKPFTPIFQAAAQVQEPVFGERPYTDARYGFNLTLYDAMTLSDWITPSARADISVLVGIDTNMFLQQSRNPSDAAGMIVLHQTQSTPQTAMQLMQKAQAYFNQQSLPARIEITSVPQEVNVADGGTGAYLTGKIYAQNLSEPVDASLLIAQRDRDAFFLLGIGANSAAQTVSSFYF